MNDATADKFAKLNPKELESLLTKFLMEKCGCTAELTAISSDPNADPSQWDVGEVSFKVKRFGRIGSCLGTNTAIPHLKEMGATISFAGFLWKLGTAGCGFRPVRPVFSKWAFAETLLRRASAIITSSCVQPGPKSR